MWYAQLAQLYFTNCKMTEPYLMVSASSGECGKQSYTIREDMGMKKRFKNKGLKRAGVCIHSQVMADSLGSLRHSSSNPDASQHSPGVFDHSAVNLQLS